MLEEFTKTQTIFDLKSSSITSLYLALIPSIALSGIGIFLVLCVVAIVYNIDNMRESFSSDALLYIIGIWCLVTGICCLALGIYKTVFLAKILLFKYRFLSIDTINQKLIIKTDKSCLIELPFEAINHIDIASKGIVKHIYIDLVDIFTSNNESYQVAITKATEFCKLLPENINIQKL